MADPAVATAAGAGVTITLVGSFLGMPFDSMMAGFVGSLVAQTFVPADVSRVRAVGMMIGAGLLAGMLTPLAEAVVLAVSPWRLPATAVHLATGSIIGMIAPAVVPILRALAARYGGRLGSSNDKSGGGP